MSGARMLELAAPEAESVLESLRYGIPPRGYVRQFTVGREAQILELTRQLQSRPIRSRQVRGSALLVRANYGAGKSHLLQVVREVALENEYVVSLIVADAQGGVRFNRMDTILGEVCRQLEVPGVEGKGVSRLFAAFATINEARLPADIRALRHKLSSGGRWDFAEVLRSSAIYVALRAWMTARDGEREPIEARVEDWLQNPANYRNQRQTLYLDLVQGLRGRFRDPRPEWKFYADGVFAFHTMGHRQSWDALADFHLVARLAGYPGMVLLVDEFEDVIQNLQRRDYKEAAFLNLFQFFRGQTFPGLAYFAVTPDFAHKCKQELLTRGVYDYDYSQFDRLPAFEMDPIDIKAILELARKIRTAHGLAYGWDAEAAVPDRALEAACQELGENPLPDRIRRAISGVVKLLDGRLQG
ncbi:MAG: ATP-binding protein [Acidobacteria bacterium]|nr:ATP-binding protein [Acidobacteriota bacterium]